MPRKNATLKQLEGKSLSKNRARMLLAIPAVLLALTAAVGGVAAEQLIFRLTNDRGFSLGALYWSAGACLVFLLVAYLAWLYRSNRLDLFIVHVGIDQLGRFLERSVRWDRNSMTGFAPIFRMFPTGKRPSDGQSRVIDISEHVASASRDFGSVVAQQKGDIKLALEGENGPAQFGFGMLSYLPPSLTLFDVIDGYTRADPEREPTLIEITSEDINEACRRPSEQQLRCQATGALRVRRDNTWDDQLAREEPDPSVSLVKLAFAAVKNESGSDQESTLNWPVFAGTTMEGDDASVPFIAAGALDEESKQPAFRQLTMTRQQDQNSVTGLMAAEYFARVLSWALWRYPQAEIHVTFRVPRSVAVAAGAILARRHQWNAQGMKVPADLADRLKLWGWLSIEKELALFEVLSPRELPLETRNLGES